MNIPFYKPYIDIEEINEVVDTLKSGWLTTGPKTKQFEINFAEFVGTKYAVALNSATAGLHLALEAIGLTKGDAVLVPTMTFAATAEVVRYFDATPVLVDCNDNDYNISIEDAYKKARMAILKGYKLRAIIPVHFAGQACDMIGIRKLSLHFDLKVIEDAAHCCPSFYRYSEREPWISVGTESDIACYSFYSNKCITTGEGGMACTNIKEYADRIRLMSLHGISNDAWKRFSIKGSWNYDILEVGYKYNLTDIASSIGLQQLKRANILQQKRETIALNYNSILINSEYLSIPFLDINKKHSWHLYVVRINFIKLKIDRNYLIEELKSKGIVVSVHYKPLHLHKYYKNKYNYNLEDFPVATKLAEEIISLPIYPSMDIAEISYVCEMLNNIIKDNVI